jgi:hypothetical protein
MSIRSQITLDPDLQRRAQKRASELGMSFAEYVRRTLAQDLGERKAATDISVIFNLVRDGPVTNIARDKDKMVGDAVWKEHLRKTKREPSVDE